MIKSNSVLAHALMLAAILGGLGVRGQAQQPAAAPGSAQGPAGQAQPATPPSANGTTSTPPAEPIKAIHQPSGSERRRATKLYLEAAKLYEQGRFEEALRDNEQALALDPANGNYRLALEVARAHAVTALIQAAAKARLQGDALAARAALSHAYQLDPQNSQLAPHLPELGDAPLPGDYNEQRGRATADIGELEPLLPAPGVRSFHFHTNQRTIIQSVFSAFSIQTTIDESIRNQTVRFDIDDATFQNATRALALVTNTFFEPIDPHHAVVALDTREFRAQFTRNGVETVYLAGMNQTEMTDIGNLARNVFEISQTAIDQTSGTLTLRASQSQLDAFNATFKSLLDGRSQVLLDVKLIQIAHSTTRNTGITPPQQVTAFNVYAEEQSILNQNRALVQQIISSGLAAPGDTLAILAILLASGQVSSSLLQNGVLLFGGGLTLSGVVTKPLTVNLSLNSSDSRELDQFQLRLGDGEDGTLKSGTRYPIQTSSFTNLGVGLPNIPGLNLPGTSTGLAGLLGNLGGTTPSIPMVQYEDLGLTLKATPSIMRSGDIALKIDMKIAALAGSALNGVPVLANRAWTGVVTVPQNQAVVVASQMDKNESRAISGVPGLSEIPGLNNITGKETGKNYSTLLIVMTPHVVRSPRLSDHTNMVRIEPRAQSH